MEVFDAVRTLLAVRGYQNKPIPPELVAKIVEAGRLTGSSMNLQPWHFIVVERKEMLVKLAVAARSGPYIADAPMAIVVAVDTTRFAESDGSRAIQSMMLTAWSEGIGSNWVGFTGMAEINTLLGIPAEIDVLAVVPFGYPAKPVGKGKKRRKPLSQVAHREQFGHPFI